VISALNKETNQKVAIKKMTPMAETKVDGVHALREIRLMRWLGKHPNIITLKDLMVNLVEDELYVVMELMDSDLHKIIQSSQPLEDAHFKHFMFQLLRGLRFAHSYGVIHRDLKPANLLVTKACDLVISDFGLARTMADDGPMTEHVVTRWYRAPEV
jgi:serine/threonine protein kinase